ncbi:MAG: N-acetylmuramoyl-L-alanine amidase [Eubacterium sp.]|nr:N-acetylmuramoyl-L-alanine amidase [Eubacterium sp.]
MKRVIVRFMVLVLVLTAAAIPQVSEGEAVAATKAPTISWSGLKDIKLMSDESMSNVVGKTVTVTIKNVKKNDVKDLTVFQSNPGIANAKKVLTKKKVGVKFTIKKVGRTDVSIRLQLKKKQGGKKLWLFGNKLLGVKKLSKSEGEKCKKEFIKNNTVEALTTNHKNYELDGQTFYQNEVFMNSYEYITKDDYYLKHVLPSIDEKYISHIYRKSDIGYSCSDLYSLKESEYFFNLAGRDDRWAPNDSEAAENIFKLGYSDGQYIYISAVSPENAPAWYHYEEKLLAKNCEFVRGYLYEKNSKGKEVLVQSISMRTDVSAPDAYEILKIEFEKETKMVNISFVIDPGKPEEKTLSKDVPMGSIVSTDFALMNQYSAYADAQRKTDITDEIESDIDTSTDRTIYLINDYESSKVAFNPSWKYGECAKITSGEATLYKNVSKKAKGKTVCVNAGHGTAGGEDVEVLCHPDGSPKIKSGSTPAGKTTAKAVSYGTTMKDGTPEAVATLKTALAVKEVLMNEGYDVLMIRESDDVQLDNIARTLIANNNADIHIAIHYDSNARETSDAFFCSIPDDEDYKNMEPVKTWWEEHMRLGDCAIAGLKSRDIPIMGDGRFDMDLTQTSFSTIPSIDLEVGNINADLSDTQLYKIGFGIREGVNNFFEAND